MYTGSNLSSNFTANITMLSFEHVGYISIEPLVATVKSQLLSVEVYLVT